MKPVAWLHLFRLCLVGLYLTGCSTQAAYMRGWSLTPAQSQRWSGGAFKVDKLSDDEKTIYAELGLPDSIRYFRTIDTRQRVYQWLYHEPTRVEWFVDRKRVDYVTVDTKLSGVEKETREARQKKLISGGIIGGIVGGVAAIFILYGDTLGVKN